MIKYYCNIIGVNKRVALARILALDDDLHYVVDFNVLLDTPDHRKEIEDNDAYDTEICKGDIEGTVDISFCCEYSAPMEWLKELSIYCDFIFEYYTDDDVNTKRFKCYAGIIEKATEEEEKLNEQVLYFE